MVGSEPASYRSSILLCCCEMEGVAPGAGPHEQPLRAGGWGPGRPSFWCVGVETQRATVAVFLVREEDAARFREEHPSCVGADLKFTHSGVEKATADAKLAAFQPPLGVITHVRKLGAQRFPNERGQLTKAGAHCLERGVRKNLIVWKLGFRCAGLNTYQCVNGALAVIHRAPEATTVSMGTVEQGQIVLALARKVATDGSVWIQLESGWARAVNVDGAIGLQAVGCQRQCGGVCQCTTACTNQIKARHGCNVQIKMERTLEHVQDSLVRVTVSGVHATDMSQWAALPLEHRAVSPHTRQVILEKMTEKSTARKVQLYLNVTARTEGAAVDGRGAVTDRSSVPQKQVIQQLMTNHRRSGQRGIPPFDAADIIIREQLRDPAEQWGCRCIYYRRPDPNANAKSDRGLYQTILSSNGCLDDAAKYGDNGHGADGTHEVVEDDIVTDGVMVCKQCTAQEYPEVPELHSGHRKNVMRLVALSLADKESEHCIRRIHESIARCMPCDRSDCGVGRSSLV